MLLHGAPLSNPESRWKHGFATRFRVVARNIGRYLEEPVIETEEIVIETPTFSFQDYLDTRVFHLLLTIYYYEGNFEEAFEFARQGGVKPFDLVMQLQTMIDEAPGPLRQMFQNFLQESQDELFADREECVKWARDNFDGLVDGTLGGNLLSKYSMLGRFFLTAESLEFLAEGIARSLRIVRGTEEAAQLHAVVDYLKSVLLHAPFAKSITETSTWSTTYDVEAWRGSGYDTHLADFPLDAEETFTTEMDPERRSVLESRLATFGEHPSQMGKFTRTMFARDLRRQVLRADRQQGSRPEVSA